MNKSGNTLGRLPWKRSVAAAVALAISATAFADTGGLRITINGNDGKPLPGATVKVSSPSSLVSKTGVTESDGTLRVTGLDPATNYTVEVMASGYDNFTTNRVAVVSGTNLSVSYNIGIVELDEALVTARGLAAIDTTSATVGTTITLDLTESLPTGRSYQSYLQFVPSTKPSNLGNPSSKSGVNYSDVGGAVGQSTDNLYYIDGVNVTDSNTGTFGSNLNSEIIQEMQVLTGGLPAEFAGGSGLVSRVTTKSGGNEFHGSINYYFQNDSLVADNKHLANADFSTYDTAVTLGGPVIKDKLWFFGSYQITDRKDDIVNPNTQAFIRKVETKTKLGFGKLTWQITDADRLTATFFNDPYKRDGSVLPTTLNNRSLIRDQGGNNYKLDFAHDFGNLRVNAYGFKHEGELTDSPADATAFNNVAYRAPFPGGVSPTNDLLQLGGQGVTTETFRDTKEFGADIGYLLATAYGEHSFKIGASHNEQTYKENTVYGAGARYTSIAASNSGTSFRTFAGTGWVGSKSLVNAASDRNGIIAALNLAANASVKARIDANANGTISTDELLDGMIFNSTAGNPYGQVNVYRILQEEGTVVPYTVTSKQISLFAQDAWTIGQWTVNAGVRGENYKFENSAGGLINKFDWNIAPRLSVVYDLNGDGRSKVWAFAGRYYDPIRTDMADFAGAITGPTYSEQAWVLDRWVTFRQRGPGDALITPSTKTPYTDEFMLGYATTLAQDVTASVTYTRRETKDIMEDYDFLLYTQDLAGTAFELPLSYFGLPADFDVDSVNFGIGTLKGGKREYDGFEFTLTKAKSNHWQGFVSYTYNDAKGNSNSDGNADFQGDVLWLDPRAPNAYGPQPGNIKHLAKLAGSYYTDFGLEAGISFNWNSGALYSRTQLLSGRDLPVQITAAQAYEFGGVTEQWIADNTIGSEKSPAYYTLDARVKYSHDIGFMKGEIFLDLFNVLNKQSTAQEQDLVAGNGVYAFGQGIRWVEPRRAYLGVRFSF